MIYFGKYTTLNDEVKFWSFEKLKEVFEGKLDYVALAKQLGIKPSKSGVTEPEIEKPKKVKKSND